MTLVDPLEPELFLRRRPLRLDRLLALLVVASTGCAECGGAGTQGVETVLVPSSDALAFGGVYLGVAPSKALQLRVLGGGSVVIRSVEIEGDAAFSFAGAAGDGFSIAHGDARTLDVTFRPALAADAVATIVVKTDLDETPELRIGLSGTGLATRDCDDDEACTTDTFDLATGACTYVRLEGPCIDGNACTTGDTCVEGRCLGRAVDCADESACTRDLCDASSGCVSITDLAACDDDNACTAESCDDDGCHHEDVANGTPCGPITGCQDVPLCVFGRCERIDAPDGTRCSDGDACTTADSCVGGTCAGTRVQRAPEVTATLSTFGTPGSDSLMLGDDRLVFSHLLDGSGERALTLVERRGDGLFVLDERVVPAHVLLAATGPDRFVVHRASTPPTLVVYSISGAGRIVERGTATIDTTLVLHAAGLDGLLLFCAHTPPLAGVQAWSTVDPDRPAFASAFGTCSSTFVADDRSRRVFSGGEVIEAWDLATPAAPASVGLVTQDAELFVGARAAGDGLLLLHTIKDNVTRLRAIDAVTLQKLGELPSEYGAQLQLGGRRAFLSGATVRARIFDFTTPTAPVEVPAAVAAPLGGRLVVGPKLVVSGFFGFDQRIFEHGGAPFSLVARTGRAHGRLGRLVERPWGLQSVSQVASHRFDLTESQPPRLDAGAMFPGASALVGLGATGGAPFAVQPAFWPLSDTLLGQNPYGFVPDGGLWTGAADAASPLVLGQVPSNVWGAVVDGHLLVQGDRYFHTDVAGLAVRDLSRLVPGFPAPLPEPSTVTLEQAQSTATARSVVSMYYLAAAPAGRRVAVAVNRDVTSVAAPQQRTRVHGVHLVDLADPAQPRLVWSSSGSQSVAAIATDGSSVLVLEAPLPIPEFDRDPRPSTLRIRRGQGGSPGAIEVPGGHRIAAFDGRVAHVLTPDGVTIVDTVGTPRILGAVPLPEHPVDARVIGDRLVVASESRLDVISPPCPP